jgi:adenine phosphoribosyltransferase
MESLAKLIRDIPDFPKPGILFKDITTLLKDAAGWREAVDAMSALFAGQPVDKVVGVEARGFAFAAPIAYKLGAGLVLVRKPGKLPGETLAYTYELEYGTDTLEIHKDAISEGENVLIVDDLLATGGTVQATAHMVEQLGGKIVGIGFLIELDFLHGREKLDGYSVKSLIHY